MSKKTTDLIKDAAIAGRIEQIYKHTNLGQVMSSKSEECKNKQNLCATFNLRWKKTEQRVIAATLFDLNPLNGSVKLVENTRNRLCRKPDSMKYYLKVEGKICKIFKFFHFNWKEKKRKEVKWAKVAGGSFCNRWYKIWQKVQSERVGSKWGE